MMKQNETPLISIVVPVYKVEKYLSRCIDSILAQTYKNFELILVDDGSPDNCGKICDEYARKDSRIKVIHQVNSGVTKARAIGVQNSTGQYICFVDSDDTLPIDTISNYIRIPDFTLYDIIIGLTENRNYSFDEIPIENYRHYCIRGEVFTPALWGKLFKKGLFVFS